MNQSLNFTSSWALAAVLAGLVAYHLVAAVTSPRLSSRINSFLHALMSASMGAIVLRLDWPVLPQLVLFALATHWFVVQSVLRAELLRCTRRDRLKCIYNAAAMAAAGLMILPLGPMSMAHLVLAPGHRHSAPTVTEIVVMPEGIYEIGAGFFVATTAGFSLAVILGALRPCREETEYAYFAQHRILGLAAEAVSAATMAMMFAVMT